MGMKRLTALIVIFCVFHLHCKKTGENVKRYYITGRFLESTSNPAPVAGLQLMAYQLDNSGWFGGTSGIDVRFTTDVSGNFSCVYSPNSSTGLFSGINTNQIIIRPADTGQYKNLFFQYYPLPLKKDTALGTLFLFRRIGQLVTQIQFDSALSANDSVRLNISAAFQTKRRMIYGPIAAGTVITDTTNDFRTGDYSLHKKTYALRATLYKPGWYEDFGQDLQPGDEAFRSWTITYK